MIDTEIRKAARVISAGGTILYPTDTIWGIGCNAGNPASVDRVYKIKMRSDQKSMLVLVASLEMLKNYLTELPEKAHEMIRSASRPTTFIYPGAKNLAPNLLAKDGSVGIRITSDEFCRGLIELLAYPIVSTSANISGQSAGSSFTDIDPAVKGAVDYVVNWRQEDNSSSSPSRIIKLDDSGNITVLRP